jgi:hypothetical protein
MASTQKSDIAPEKGAVDVGADADTSTHSDLKKMLHDTKVDGGRKSVWQMTVETFGMADGGNEKKEDVICSTLEEAVSSLEAMLKAEKDKHPKWQLTLVPFDQFNATLADLIRAFCCWVKKDGENFYNVSKAFRRLDVYATWMEDHRADLEKPLTKDSIREVADLWMMKLTPDAKSKGIVMWLDVGALDLTGIRQHVTQDSLRYTVWQCHLVMFDKRAQDNGLVVVQAMGFKGMIETFTMVPMDLGTKLDRLTIGVLPLKVKSIIMFNHRRWLSIVMTLLRPLLGKKMRQRITIVPKNQEPQAVLDEAVGRDSIPVGFGGLNGNVEEDIIYGQYLK